MVPGYLQDQSSLQSEVAGLHGIMVLANAICKEHQITKEEMEVRCNHIEALCRAFDLDYCISPNHTHFNLTTAIHYQVWTTLIKWKVRHVRVHQDDNPFQSLNWWAKLNVEVVQLAKAYLHTI